MKKSSNCLIFIFLFMLVSCDRVVSDKNNISKNEFLLKELNNHACLTKKMREKDSLDYINHFLKPSMAMVDTINELKIERHRAQIDFGDEYTVLILIEKNGILFSIPYCENIESDSFCVKNTYFEKRFNEVIRDAKIKNIPHFVKNVFEKILHCQIAQSKELRKYSNQQDSLDCQTILLGSIP
ncbi:MAG: hypothetical protein U0V72_04615 [Cytophagales bacterium]